MMRCFTEVEIDDFLSDSLSEEEDRRIDAHAEECASCRQRLETAGDDPALHHLRSRLAAPVASCSQEFLDEMAAGGVDRWAGTEKPPEFEVDSGFVVSSSAKPSKPAEAAPLPESIGQYQVVARIGSGGMGVVYEAVHPRLKRHVALKVVAAHRLADAETIQRFHREMESIGQLQHPNIIQAHDAGEADGVHFLVMELVVGSDLESVARATGRLAIADACDIVRQAALGLGHAHTHGLIHRDIKPSNLLLSRTGVVKIVDLGLARLLEGSPAEHEITGTGIVLGTVDYMSPEQGLGGGRNLDGRSDLYGLGCVLYRLLAGQVPYPESTTPHQKLVAHAQQEPADLRSIRPDVPAELTALVERMMAKQPEDRFATADDIAEALVPFAESASLPALLEVAADSPVATQPTDLLRGSTEFPKRHAVPSEKKPSRSRRLRWWGSLLTAFAAVPVVALVLGPRLFPQPNDGPAPQSADVEVSNELVADGEPRASQGGGTAEEEGEKRADVIPVDLARESDPSGARSFDDLEPLFWENLMDVPPHELYWGNDKGHSTWHYETRAEQVVVNADDYGVLALGATNEPNFRFRISIHQARWATGAGIFLGYRVGEDEKGRPTRSCQFMRVKRYQDNNSVWHFGLERGRLSGSVRDDGEVGFLDATLMGDKIANPSGEITLEIQVRNGWLDSVKLDGAPLEKLTEPRGNRQFEPRDYQGAFGIFTTSSASTFRDGRFMILPSK